MFDIHCKTIDSIQLGRFFEVTSTEIGKRGPGSRAAGLFRLKWAVNELEDSEPNRINLRVIALNLTTRTFAPFASEARTSRANWIWWGRGST